MSLDQYLERIAKAEGVSRGEAESHARAVFAALRRIVSDNEIYDVESELPGEYASLLSGVVGALARDGPHRRRCSSICAARVTA